MDFERESSSSRNNNSDARVADDDIINIHPVLL